eukprot:s689_g42.t4
MEPARRVPGASSAIWNISIRGASCADRSDPGTERERLETMRELLAMLIFQWHLERQVIKFRLEQQLRLVLAVVGRHVRGLRQAQTPTELEFCQVMENLWILRGFSLGQFEVVANRRGLDEESPMQGQLEEAFRPRLALHPHLQCRWIDGRWIGDGWRPPTARRNCTSTASQEMFYRDPRELSTRPARYTRHRGSTFRSSRQRSTPRTSQRRK